MFENLLKKLNTCSDLSFIEATNEMGNYILQLPRDGFLNVLIHIGIIPESIEHDSTAEKLFSKVSDIVLSRAFREIGLKSDVLTERADSADVIAKSTIHDYDLVADAKAFRLSRTAKNQKDFKVEALSNWKKDSNYAILTSPYFQYPSISSQIYAQALNKNVCLLSWEHLIFLIQNNIKESECLNLSALWNFSGFYSENCTISRQKDSFLQYFDKHFCDLIDVKIEDYDGCLDEQICTIQKRGKIEKQFWLGVECEIKHYTREKAIEELLLNKKIDSKIRQIDKYIKGLR